MIKCLFIKKLSKKNIRNFKKGAFTIEASIIMPIVIFCILVLIFMSALLYEKAALQSLADRYAHMAANIWNEIPFSDERPLYSKDATGIPGGMEVNSEAPLYWRIFDINKTRKEDYIRNCIIHDLEDSSINKISDLTEVKVNIRDYFIIKKIKIEVIKNCDIFPSGIAGLFSASGGLRIAASSESVVEDSSEFVRSIDFISELGKQLETQYSGFKRFGDSVRNAFKKAEEIFSGLSDREE